MAMDPRILRRLELLETKFHRQKKAAARSANVQANINVTPLVDVVLVLLIIFMVVTPMLQRDIDLPKVKEPEAMSQADSDLNVSVDAEGEIAIDRERVSLLMLPDRLSREIIRNPARAVYLHADRSLPFGRVRPVLQACRDAGARQVGLASVPEKEEPTGGAE